MKQQPTGRRHGVGLDIGHVQVHDPAPAADRGAANRLHQRNLAMEAQVQTPQYQQPLAVETLPKLSLHRLAERLAPVDTLHFHPETAHADSDRALGPGHVFPFLFEVPES
jgi:hypothetical protein